MGFFNWSQPEEEYDPAPAPERGEPVLPQPPVNRDSVLGQGQTLEGKLTGIGTIRVDGTVQGDIVLQGSLTVSRSGQVIGTVEATNVVLSGRVEGSVIAHGKLCLASTCDFTGDAQAELLTVEEGARFNGTSKMLPPSASTQEPDRFPPSGALQFGDNYSLELEDEGQG